MEILSLNEFLTNDIWFYDRMFNRVSVIKIMRIMKNFCEVDLQKKMKM